MSTELSLSPAAHVDFKNQNLSDFKFQLMKLCSFLIEHEGYDHLAPYSEGSLNIFQGMTPETQIRIIKDVASSLKIYQSLVNEGVQLRNSLHVLSGMVSSLRLKTNDDAFDYVENDDVLEIYHLDQTQIFRSPKFLALCSYPIADLYVRTWKDLYARPDSMTDLTAKMITYCLSKKETIVTNLPDYFLMELDSALKRLFFMRQKVLAPVYRLDQSLVGFLRTLRGHRAESYEDVFQTKDYLYSEHSLGNFLKTLREKNKYSLQEAGTLIGHNALYVKEVEHNRTLPNGTDILKFCHLYGVKPAEVLDVLTHLSARK